MKHTLGIDLGTTYSAVAVVRSGGTPELLWNRDGHMLTPSVVLFQDSGVPLVGAAAKNSAALMPEDCVQFIKREMGNRNFSFTDSRGAEHRPEEISAAILKRLVADAGDQLDEPATEVVITVPAYFDDTRRTATRDAGEIAGLSVLRLVNEPTAAAIAFGLNKMTDGRLLVYDLGGGTFDVTVLRVAGGADFEVIATDGDRNLGGFDFDNALMSHVAGEVSRQGGPDLLDDVGLAADLRERCEQAKRTLSVASSVKIRAGVGKDAFTVEVTRQLFQELTTDLLERTEILIEAVLEEAALGWDGIDKVLLVGGSTRMPAVQDLVRRLSGRKPETGINPDEAVALGAAIFADSVAAKQTGRPPNTVRPVSVQDVTSQSLGTIVLDETQTTLINVPVIRKNSKIPCKDEAVHYTTHANQSYVDFSVTEGEDSDPEYVTVLDKRDIQLPPGLPKDSPLRTIMRYDVDGVVHAELVDDLSGRSLGEVQLQRPFNLKHDEVSAMRAAMRALDVE
jgi:molecular chaperone DnaK